LIQTFCISANPDQNKVNTYTQSVTAGGYDDSVIGLLVAERTAGDQSASQRPFAELLSSSLSEDVE
jgi:hypothetical protein